MKRLPGFIRLFIVVILQLIATQVLTFAGSFLFPNMEQPGLVQPVPFALMLGITFTAGIFLVGWLALNRGWLDGPPNLMLRFFGTLIGIYIVLFAGVILMKSLPAGSPYMGISLLVGLISFHLPGRTKK